MDGKIIEHQYYETLILLVEKNVNHYWLECFYELRNGKGLPGGGAGSLNDWGPTYFDKFEDNWYEPLYRILHRNYWNNQIDDSPHLIEDPYKLRILACKHCKGLYQHPDPFERQQAERFYNENFSRFVLQNKLTEILEPGESFFSNDAKLYREWLSNEYKVNNIEIYDFIKGEYSCIHCGHKHTSTRHDLYLVSKNNENRLTFRLVKEDADFNDFKWN